MQTSDLVLTSFHRSCQHPFPEHRGMATRALFSPANHSYKEGKFRYKNIYRLPNWHVNTLQNGSEVLTNNVSASKKMCELQPGMLSLYTDSTMVSPSISQLQQWNAKADWHKINSIFLFYM